MTDRDPAYEAWQERARAADVLDVAVRLCGAGLKGRGRERSGPCPRCGGSDRFSVNTQKQLFNCRGAAGGSVIDMVMHCHAVPYLAACEIITGEAPPAKGTQLTDEARAAAETAKRESAERAARREADNAWYRQRERERTREMWDRAHPLQGSSAADYLTRRGLAFPDTPEGRDRLKCIEAMPYWATGKKDAVILHRGPAMVAPIVDAGRKFRGLHLTYLDLSQAKGKLRLADPDNAGATLEAKKARGSKAGNRVELIGPREPKVLVLGEGIEKVLAVWMALVQVSDARGELANIDELMTEHAAFWSACDLGNLAGPARETVAHPTLKGKGARPLRVAGPDPDVGKPGIEIPDSVTDLVLLGDSTSEPFTTQLAMCRAAARYAKPGRTVRVAWAPPGRDFDDLWREAADDAQRAAVAETIAKIVRHAKPPVMPALTDPAAARAPKAQQRAAEINPPSEHSSPADAGDRHDSPDSSEAALGPAPPLAAPARPSLLATLPISRPSRTGRSRSELRGKWGGSGHDVGGPELDHALAFYPMTDLGNAERCVQRFRNRLKWSPAHGWLAWNKQAWSAESAASEVKIAEHMTVRGIQDEAKAIEDDANGIAVVGAKEVEAKAREKASTEGKVVSLAEVKAAKKAAREAAKQAKEKKKDLAGLAAQLRRFGRDSEARPRMSAVSDGAMAYLHILPKHLDADPFKINVANGTLVVRRDWSKEGPDSEHWTVINEFIRFKPHDPDDLITKVAPVVFDPEASCQEYDKFLETVQPSADIRRHLHQCGGMCLTGDTSEHVMWFNWGKGRNGKSTLFNAWANVIGDYSRSVSIETFLNAQNSRSGAAPSPDLARLAGVRFVRTSEPERGAKLAEALIKLATGGEPLTVRHLNKEFFDLQPQFKVVMAGNYRPDIRGTDDGIWARMRLIPWTVSIPREARDLHLGDKLQEEASGILNRLLEGLCDWLQHGLTFPREIEQATADYRRDSDPLGRFLAACIETKEGEREQSSALHRLFCAWCRANGEKEWTATGFGKAMAERGFARRHSDVNWWLNIRAIKTVADFEGESGPPPHGEPIEKQPPPARRLGAEFDADEGF